MVKEEKIMKRNTAKLILLAAAVIAASCAKEPATTEDIAQGYKINIEADFSATKAVADGGAATFAVGEQICVYNKTQNALDANLLSAASAGANTTFSGTLAGTYAVGDVLQLFYNTTSEVVDYTTQDGTIGGVADVAVATVSVTGVSGGTVSTGKASFTNLQSIFKFTFKNGTSPLNVRAVTIRSTGGKLVAKDDQIADTKTYGAVSISNDVAQPAVYAALKFDANASDVISFTLVDENGILYTGTKAAPAGGLVDGNFYTSVVSLTPTATMPFPFTISTGPATTAYLAAGNLYYKDGQYSFYPCKTPFYEPSGSLTKAERRDRSWFQWSVVDTKFASSASTQDVYFNGTASKGWFALTKDQVNCLISGRSTLMDSGVAAIYKVRETYGILLPPDNATPADVEGLLKDSNNALTETQVLRYISKGFAFLRCSGWYNSENSNYVGSKGYYWTATSYSSENAYECHFDSSVFPTTGNQPKTQYFPVRLAHN